MTADHSTSCAVLYLRMSTTEQDQSIASQRAALKRYAKKHGYKIVDEYTDEGISGDKTEKRAAFLKMARDAADGTFSVILCWDQDRFGRFDLLDSGHYIKPFRDAGVRLETIAQGRIDWDDPTGQLLYQVQQHGKHNYLRDLSRNVLRGLTRTAKEARASMAIAPVGYKTHREYTDGGKLIRSYLKVDPARAKVVKMIFREYLKPSSSLGAVARMLNEKGIAPQTNSRTIKPVWAIASVKVVLTNQKYLGHSVWGKKSCGSYHERKDGEIVPKKRKATTRGEIVTVKDTHEPIIDQATFDQAQRLLQQRRNKPKASPEKRLYLFTGILRCGNCGGRMSGIWKKGKYYYRCSRYVVAGKKACTCNDIAEDTLLQPILKRLADVYASDKAIARLRDAVRKEAKRASKNDDLATLKAELRQIEKQIKNGRQRIFDAPASVVDGLYAELEKMEKRKESLSTAIASTKPGKTGEAPEIKQAISAMRNLRRSLGAAKREDLREIMQQCIRGIEARFDSRTVGTRTRCEFKGGTVHANTLLDVLGGQSPTGGL